MATPVPTLLIDRRNFVAMLPTLLEVMSSCKTLIGIDCETHDDNRHPGLNQFMKVNEETRKKAGNKKLVFDVNRTVMTGFSLYPENSAMAYYFNLAHADHENCLTWEEVQPVIDAKPADTLWIAHNAPYEITFFAQCLGYQLTNIVCTMQLSVTAFGDDNYDLMEYRMSGLRDLEQHLYPLMHAAIETQPQDLEPDEDGGERRRFSRKVDEIIGKITAKEADASTTYNGYVDDIAYGHGLKNLVWKFFGHQMDTFAETIGDQAHMGQKTGDEIASYGAEDAYWVVPLFHKLMQYVAIHSPDALETFFTQENPMIYVFSDIWREGMKVNFTAIESRRVVERAEFARILRELKVAVRAILPWQKDPNPELVKRQSWYYDGDKPTAQQGYTRYREKITKWANSPDFPNDDFAQCFQVSSPVSNAWAEEEPERAGRTKAGKLLKSDFSITHYMPARVFLYDLLGGKLMFDKGKLTSDGEARGKVQDWFKQKLREGSQTGENEELIEAKIKVIELMTALASVEQRMKLYLTPYVLLTDPDTQRMYPSVNCLLNTRRLAASSPNPMQLAKRGESTYVRGFFLPDYDDHVIVSLDWSAFELVIIGELSGDAEFRRAFGQLPHDDMHSGAAADIFRVEIPWMNEDIFKGMKKFESADDWAKEYSAKAFERDRMFTNLKGEAMAPAKAVKYWRTEIGKGANFNYWYSGFLTTVGERMGWGLSRTGEATDFYRARFAGGEQWRLDTIDHGNLYGYVQLPDGHRRFRYEAMYEWMDVFKAKWPDIVELKPIIHEIARRIHKRAQNQLVNAMVQGTNAFIIKRSIIECKRRLKEMGWTNREARFLMPVHDEKIWSVHKDLVVEFIALAREVMMTHPDVFKTLKLDATPAVGLTFEPYDKKKASFGQIELFELPDLDVIDKASWGGRATDDQTRQVVDYLIHERQRIGLQ